MEKETENATKSAEKTTETTEIVADEFCEDEEYNSDVDESVSEELIDVILVEPEGAMHFSKEILEENLRNVGINPLQITEVTNEKGKANALVKIKPARKEKVKDAMFPLSVHGWKMEFPQVNFTTPSISRVEV